MTTAIATTSNDFNDMRAILEENGVSLSMSDLKRIKVPAGGATSFEVPDGNGDTTPHKFLEGIIVAKRSFRLYYAEEYNGTKQAPTCQSHDGITGTGTPGGACKTCPLNAWGSGRNGIGRACSEKLAVYVLLEGDLMPVVLTLPSTSIGNFNKYMTALTMARKTFYGVKTRIGLTRVESKSGIKYSQVTFAQGAALSAEEFEQARQSKLFFTALLNSTPVEEPVDAPATETWTNNPDGTVTTPSGITF